MRDFFYPLLTPLARPLRRLHPNTISTFSLLTGCGAGVAYWAAHHGRVFYLVAAALVVVSGLADCFDGIVAREYGKESAFGDFLDHVFDRFVNMAIFVGLAFSPNASVVFALVVAIVILLNSYLGTQIHASFGQRDYSGLGKAQLFIVFVVGSIALAIAPEFRFEIAARSVSLVDGLLALILAGTVQAMVHRVRLAWRLSRED